MTTTKSYSSRSFFGTAMRRHFAFMMCSSILMLIIIVLPHILVPPTYFERTNLGAFSGRFASGVFLGGAVNLGFAIVVLMMISLACALLSAQHMHNMRMSDLFHSLPIRREKVMLANLGAAMVATLGPMVVLTILTMLGILVEFGGLGLLGGWFFATVLADIFTISVAVFVIYAFTMFIAVQVGTSFDTFALTLVLGFLPPSVYGISWALWEASIFGAYPTAEIALWALRISPFLFFGERLLAVGPARWSVDEWPLSASLGGMVPLVVWMFIGVFIFAGAVWLYRSRKSELAGSIQPQGHLQMIAKLFAGFLGGALFTATTWEHGALAQVVAIILATPVIGMLAELILSRGFRGAVRNLKWLAASGGVYALLFVTILVFDITGAAVRVPQMDSVQSVSINFRGRFASESILLRDSLEELLLTEPESMAIVLAAHQHIVDEFIANGRVDGPWRGFGQTIQIQYNLSGGRTLARRYHIFRNSDNLSPEALGILSALDMQPDFIANNHPLFLMERFDGWVQVFAGMHTLDGTFVDFTDLSNPRSGIEPLLEALRADMLAETPEEIADLVHPVVAYIQLDFFGIVGSDMPYLLRNRWTQAVSPWFEHHTIGMGLAGRDWRGLGSTQIPVTAGFTNTLPALSRMGVLTTPDPGDVYMIRAITFGAENESEWNEWWRLESQVHRLDYGPFISDNVGMDIDWLLRREEPEFIPFYLTDITDPEDIAAILGRGHATLRLTPENIASSAIIRIYAGQGQLLGTQFIPLEVLPDLSIQANEDDAPDTTMVEGEDAVDDTDGNSEVLADPDLAE